VKESQGQMIITAGQIIWTHECEKALADADSARRAVKALKKKWIRYGPQLSSCLFSHLCWIVDAESHTCICVNVYG